VVGQSDGLLDGYGVRAQWDLSAELVTLSVQCEEPDCVASVVLVLVVVEVKLDVVSSRKVGMPMLEVD
jgi:hypothetical protein